jgi:glycerol-1-phosphate dehydrogenase [NAD(P)+]
LGEKLENLCYFETPNHYLVPNEEAIAKIESLCTNKTDFILGIGSGVINDLTKYVSFNKGIKSGIIASATSMDGFASSGAALILKGMQVTYTTHAPYMILGDTNILKDAPIDMIRSGYADIIAKYSALCDWKLSALINNEFFCSEIYNTMLSATNEMRSLAKELNSRSPYVVGKLMEILVLSGVLMTLGETTRPASGSEHHFSHYFHITGLIENKPFFLHGTDVGYTTIITTEMREKILTVENPEFTFVPKETRENFYKEIFHDFYTEVAEIQEKAKRYENPVFDKYKENWGKVKEILLECPSSQEIKTMLADVGIDLAKFRELYDEKRIENGMWFAKDIKDRYSVLWLYFDLFFAKEKL